MSKDALKELIDVIDERDIETIFQILIRFVPEEKPLSDEIEAINDANKSIEQFGTVSHNCVNWD